MKSFLNREKPIFTTMLQVRKPEDCYSSIERAISLGTDAFGFQIEQFSHEYRTKEIFCDLFENRMKGYPVYATNYRSGLNGALTDEECAEGLLTALECGATLGDVIGNLYDREAEDELAKSPVAIEKQKRLIDKMHDMGKEVLISSHIWHSLPTERILEIAHAQQERGADIAKIVVAATSPEEEIEGLRVLTLLKKELKIPFLFLCAGEHCQLERMAGGYFGNALSLCVERYDELATRMQPPLEKAKRFFSDLYYAEK